MLTAVHLARVLLDFKLQHITQHIRHKLCTSVRKKQAADLHMHVQLSLGRQSWCHALKGAPKDTIIPRESSGAPHFDNKHLNQPQAGHQPPVTTQVHLEGDLGTVVGQMFGHAMRTCVQWVAA